MYLKKLPDSFPLQTLLFFFPFSFPNPNLSFPCDFVILIEKPSSSVYNLFITSLPTKLLPQRLKMEFGVVVCGDLKWGIWELRTRKSCKSKSKVDWVLIRIWWAFKKKLWKVWSDCGSDWSFWSWDWVLEVGELGVRALCNENENLSSDLRLGLWVLKSGFELKVSSSWGSEWF